MMRARTHKQSDICALWAPAISGGLDRAQLLPMMRYWLVEKCQCWITAWSCEGIGENGSRFSRRPLGEAVSVLLCKETLRELDHRAYGPHYWRATTSCSQRNRCFSQSRSPRGHSWYDHWLVCDFFQLCFWTFIYRERGKQDSRESRHAMVTHPVGGTEIEEMRGNYFCSLLMSPKSPQEHKSLSFECVCLIQLEKSRNFKHEADKPVKLKDF